MHLIFWFLLLTFLVHHLEALPLIVQLILKKVQPPGDGKALTSQVKKYNVSLQQTYYCVFLASIDSLQSNTTGLLTNALVTKDLEML